MPIVTDGLLLLALLMTFAAVVLCTRNLTRSLEVSASASYRSADVLMKDTRVNFFGIESVGVRQIRGMGSLVLTRTHLHFFRYFPRLDITIAVDSITEVALAGSHLSKLASRHQLLKVKFSTNDNEDSIAWSVAEVHSWKSQIEALRVGKDKSGSGE